MSMLPDSQQVWQFMDLKKKIQNQYNNKTRKKEWQKTGHFQYPEGDFNHFYLPGPPKCLQVWAVFCAM